MSNEHTPLFDVVATGPDVAAALWAGALTERTRRLTVRGLRGAAIEPLRQAATATGWRPWVRSTTTEPHIDLTADGWELATRGLSGNVRHNVRRRRRRLEDQGAVRLEVAPAAAPGLLDEALAIEASGWKGEHGTAIASSERTERFYRRLAQLGSAEGWLQLAVLRLGDEGIACQLLARHDRTWFGLKVGYDETYARFGPGWALLWDLLDAADGAGIDRYDFAGEGSAAMDRWANGATEVHRVEVFHPVLGVGDRLALEALRPLVKRARDEARTRWSGSPIKPKLAQVRHRARGPR